MMTGLTISRQRLMIWGLLLGIFFLGMALRLHDLDADSLWYDEIWTASCARLDLPSLVIRTTGDVHPPLMYIVTWFFIILSGSSDFIVRLQAMLFGSLSILLAYKLGEILWTKKEGLIGAFLLAVNAYHVRYSQEARQYALMVFLALLSLILLSKALRKNHRRLWIGFALCAALSIYNVYFAIMPLASQLLFASSVIAGNWLSRRKEGGRALGIRVSSSLSPPAKQALLFGSSLVLVGLLFLPWLPAMWQQIFGERIGWQGFAAEVISEPSVSVDYFHDLLRTYSGLGGVLLVLLFCFFVGGLASSRRQHVLLIASWVAIPIAFPLLIRAQRGFNPRYTIFVVPIYLLTIGRGVVFGARGLSVLLGSREDDRKWLSQLSLTLAALTFGILSTAPLRDYYLMQKQDYRGAARYLRDNMAPGDMILADSLNPHRGGANQVKLSLTYYLDSYGIMEAPIFPVERGLWPKLQNSEYYDGQVWAALFYPRTLIATETVEVVDFYHVPLVRLSQPSGDVLDDAVLMLQALPELLRRPDACFDVYLTLAEAYLQAGEFEQAVQQLYRASLVKPDDLVASGDLTDMRGELAQLSLFVDKDIQGPSWRSLGEVVAFLGYSIDQKSIQSGGSLGITLWWQALAEMDRDYSVFIHMVGSDDRIWAQQDELLQHNGRPTSGWEVGEMVGELYELELDPDIPLGEYTVKVGMYSWETGERLPVWDENGERVADDAVLLETIAISQ